MSRLRLFAFAILVIGALVVHHFCGWVFTMGFAALGVMTIVSSTDTRKLPLPPVIKGGSGGESYDSSFERVRQTAKNGRSKGDWDGLAEWGKLKVEFSENPVDGLKWANGFDEGDIATFREHLLKELPEKDKDGVMSEPNHFIIQCTRIPFLNKPLNLRRLHQVAYNIGQMQSCLGEYPKEILDKFYALKLDKIETYIAST